MSSIMDLAKLTFEDSRRGRAQAPQVFQGAMSGAQRAGNGTIMSQDPVERERQDRERWAEIARPTNSAGLSPEALMASRGGAAAQWGAAGGIPGIDPQKLQEMMAYRNNETAIRNGAPRSVVTNKGQLTTTVNPDGSRRVTGPWGDAWTNPTAKPKSDPKPLEVLNFNFTNPFAGAMPSDGTGFFQTPDKSKGETMSAVTATPGTLTDVFAPGTPEEPTAPSTFDRSLLGRIFAGVNAIPNAVVDLMGSGAELASGGQFNSPGANYMTDFWSNLNGLFPQISGTYNLPDGRVSRPASELVIPMDGLGNTKLDYKAMPQDQFEQIAATEFAKRYPNVPYNPNNWNAIELKKQLLAGTLSPTQAPKSPDTLAWEAAEAYTRRDQ